MKPGHQITVMNLHGKTEEVGAFIDCIGVRDASHTAGAIKRPFMERAFDGFADDLAADADIGAEMRTIGFLQM